MDKDLIILLKALIAHHDWRAKIQNGDMGTCEKTIEPIREYLMACNILPRGSE